LSDEDIQKEILEFLYNFWLSDPFSSVYLEKIIQNGLIKATEEELLRNAEYLASKGLIKEPRTVARFLTQITVYGVDSIENKRLSPDVDIRRKILQVLKDDFDEDPHKYVIKEDLISRTGSPRLKY